MNRMDSRMKLRIDCAILQKFIEPVSGVKWTLSHFAHEGSTMQNSSILLLFVGYRKTISSDIYCMHIFMARYNDDDQHNDRVL